MITFTWYYNIVSCKRDQTKQQNAYIIGRLLLGLPDRVALSNFAMQTFQGVVQQKSASKYLHVPNSQLAQI